MRVKSEFDVGLFDILVDHLKDVYGDFLSDVSSCLDERYVGMLFLNSQILGESAGHAWVDMQRMSELHLPDDGQTPDRHKYAAFVSKWVAKLKPIGRLNSDLQPDGNLVVPTVNALFAVYVFRSFLNSALPVNLHRELAYMFHYRDERGEMLSVLAYTCEKISMLEKG